MFAVEWTHEIEIKVHAPCSHLKVLRTWSSHINGKTVYQYYVTSDYTFLTLQIVCWFATVDSGITHSIPLLNGIA